MLVFHYQLKCRRGVYFVAFIAILAFYYTGMPGMHKSLPQYIPQQHPSAPFIQEIESILKSECSPWDIAVKAWRFSGVWPVSFSRSSSLFLPPPPTSVYETLLSPSDMDFLYNSKLNNISTMMPGSTLSHIFNSSQEQEYLAQYIASWKAWTRIKGGADCNRHLEIVTSGTIPLFSDIKSVPPTTLFAYPKKLLVIRMFCLNVQ